MVIKWLRRAHLQLPCRASANAMTFIAIQAFRPGVLCVTEADTESYRSSRHAPMAAELVADAAGRNVFLTCLCVRCMTTKACRMSVEASRYRNRHSSAQRLV